MRERRAHSGMRIVNPNVMEGVSMEGRGAGLFAHQSVGRTLRYPMVALFMGVGVLVAAAPGDAAPVSRPGHASAAPELTLVRDYCGHGYRRPNKQRTKWGAWVGKCVPNKPKKKQQPAGQPTSPAQNHPVSTDVWNWTPFAIEN